MRPIEYIADEINNRFLLTHLLRGATHLFVEELFYLGFLLTHLLRGATIYVHIHSPNLYISTHAPLARCDRSRLKSLLWCTDFYSRTSCEVRRCQKASNTCDAYFYSRTSCEVRRWYVYLRSLIHSYFYSRTSCEVRHFLFLSRQGRVEISTHAPLARCDAALFCQRKAYFYFYSRTSCEVRRFDFVILLHRKISTHAPLARCDTPYHWFYQNWIISTHAPLARCDVGTMRAVFWK